MCIDLDMCTTCLCGFVSVGVLCRAQPLPHVIEQQGQTGSTGTAVSGLEQVATVFAAGGKLALDHLKRRGEEKSEEGSSLIMYR